MVANFIHHTVQTVYEDVASYFVIPMENAPEFFYSALSETRGKRTQLDYECGACHERNTITDWTPRNGAWYLDRCRHCGANQMMELVAGALVVNPKE